MAQLIYPGIAISTHALTWSATGDAMKEFGIRTNFNSRAHVERDPHGAEQIDTRLDFNSRAHVERDALARP